MSGLFLSLCCVSSKPDQLSISRSLLLFFLDAANSIEFWFFFSFFLRWYEIPNINSRSFHFGRYIGGKKKIRSHSDLSLIFYLFSLALIFPYFILIFATTHRTRSPANRRKDYQIELIPLYSCVCISLWLQIFTFYFASQLIKLFSSLRDISCTSFFSHSGKTLSLLSAVGSLGELDLFTDPLKTLFLFYFFIFRFAQNFFSSFLFFLEIFHDSLLDRAQPTTNSAKQQYSTEV